MFQVASYSLWKCFPKYSCHSKKTTLIGWLFSILNITANKLMAITREVTSQAKVTYCGAQGTQGRVHVASLHSWWVWWVFISCLPELLPLTLGGLTPLHGAQTDPAEGAGGGRQGSYLHDRLSGTSHLLSRLPRWGGETLAPPCVYEGTDGCWKGLVWCSCQPRNLRNPI